VLARWEAEWVVSCVVVRRKRRARLVLAMQVGLELEWQPDRPHTRASRAPATRSLLVAPSPLTLIHTCSAPCVLRRRREEAKSIASHQLHVLLDKISGSLWVLVESCPTFGPDLTSGTMPIPRSASLMPALRRSRSASMSSLAQVDLSTLDSEVVLVGDRRGFTGSCLRFTPSSSTGLCKKSLAAAAAASYILGEQLEATERWLSPGS
jgi:hypothetical protein